MKVAVSRLPFAPGPRGMEVTDIREGRFVFQPRPEVPVSLSGLRKAITDAGYEVERAWLEVTGELLPDGPGGRLRVAGTGQTFLLEGEGAARILAETAPGTRLTVFGAWRETPEGQALAAEEWAPGERIGGKG